MQSRRYRRKSRKMRKSRKLRRGGAPAPISEVIVDPRVTREDITFTVSNGTPQIFKPNFAYTNPSMLRYIFSLALMQNINSEYDLYSEDPLVLNDDIEIHRIRGAEDILVFDGKMTDWYDERVQNFLVEIQPGDRVNLVIK